MPDTQPQQTQPARWTLGVVRVQPLQAQPAAADKRVGRLGYSPLEVPGLPPLLEALKRRSARSFVDQGSMIFRETATTPPRLSVRNTSQGRSTKTDRALSSVTAEAAELSVGLSNGARRRGVVEFPAPSLSIRRHCTQRSWSVPVDRPWGLFLLPARLGQRRLLPKARALRPMWQRLAQRRGSGGSARTSCESSLTAAP